MEKIRKMMSRLVRIPSRFPPAALSAWARADGRELIRGCGASGPAQMPPGSRAGLKHDAGAWRRTASGKRVVAGNAGARDSSPRDPGRWRPGEVGRGPSAGMRSCPRIPRPGSPERFAGLPSPLSGLRCTPRSVDPAQEAPGPAAAGVGLRAAGRQPTSVSARRGRGMLRARPAARFTPPGRRQGLVHRQRDGRQRAGAASRYPRSKYHPAALVRSAAASAWSRAPASARHPCRPG
jgi:hypothetical protein